MTEGREGKGRGGEGRGGEGREGDGTRLGFLLGILRVLRIEMILSIRYAGY